jgi:hypothetical protein
VDPSATSQVALNFTSLFTFLTQLMPLFLLTPVGGQASDWAFSSINESVQVEAESEERARRRANLFFAVAASFTPGSKRQLVSPPWDQRHLVMARVIEEPDLAVRLILAGDTPP